MPWLFDRQICWIAQAATQVEEVFRWERLPPAWIIALLILPLIALYAAFFYRREAISGGSEWRWGLGGVRFLVILSVLAMLARPLYRWTTYETHDSTILVMVDDSVSMDIVDRYADRDRLSQLSEFFGSSAESIESTTRYDLVRRLFADDSIGLL